jgi:hypothetical protein
MAEDYPHDESVAHGHEPLEVDTRGVWISAGALVATIVASMALIGWLFWFLSLGRGTSAVTDPTDEATPRAVSKPNLDANQLEQLRQLRRREHELLSTSAWVDPQVGIARIPIERATQIISERGLGAIAFPPPVTTTQTEAVTGRPPDAADETPPVDEETPNE